MPPIVPVLKKDGTIHICGDYKVTVNPSLHVDQYPLPKPADLMASLRGDKAFSKLDLTSAYQQIVLHEGTINTHQGLYDSRPFGEVSAPAFFSESHGFDSTGYTHSRLLFR